MGHTIPTVMTDGSQEQEVHAMRKKKPFHDPAPDIHDFPGVPESTFDLVNQYGTYNIQCLTKIFMDYFARISLEV